MGKIVPASVCVKTLPSVIRLMAAAPVPLVIKESAVRDLAWKEDMV